MRLRSISGWDSFRTENLANWIEITGAWTSRQLPHVADLRDWIQDEASLRFSAHTRPLRIVDVGCGNGWVLDTLRSTDQRFSYTGVDFNPALIGWLRETYDDEPRADFIKADLETGAFRGVDLRADWVISIFSLFECRNLSAAVTFCASVLAADGIMSVASINPVTQILAISDDADQLRENLSLYERLGADAGYKKRIEFQNGVGQETYMGILYSVADYTRVAREQGFFLDGLEEMNRCGAVVPQIYELMRFERSAE